METEVAVKMLNLNFQYAKANKKALSNIRLQIPKGKFTAVMGETGAGKTTLLMAMNGLIPQFIEGEMEGSVNVSGQLTDEIPIQGLIQKIGLVLQDPETQIFGLTVEEDVAFGPSNLDIPVEELRPIINSCLSKVGLCKYNKRSTEFLSGGEKQRLAIAGIMAIGPDIIILDEPTSELDPEGKEAIFKIIEQLKVKEKMTIVMAEHETENILTYADHVIVLKDGEIQWQGHPTVFFAHKKLVSMFQLRAPGVAQLYWKMSQLGYDLGEVCPRTVEDLYKLLFEKGMSNNKKQNILINKDNAENKRQQCESILKVKNLYHTYTNGHKALNDINLNIYEGEYIAIIGQNGAGKSTLCKHFNKLLQPTKGKILFNGEDISNKTTMELSKQIGYVFQNPDHQIFSSSVLEEVMYGLKIRQVNEKTCKEKALEILELVGLEQYIDVHPFSLSKGYRQRLAVASILALEPKVLVIDEPTTGQDWLGMKTMLTLIDRLHKRGHTIIVITHNMSIVTEHADRVLIMGKGQLLKDCHPLEAFKNKDILREAKIKPPQIVQLANKLNTNDITNVQQLVDYISKGE